jgi:hypothetical protein
MEVAHHVTKSSQQKLREKLFPMKNNDAWSTKREYEDDNLDDEKLLKKVKTTNWKSCDLCGNVDSLHLHRIESLPLETIEKLEAVTGRALDDSMRLCCEHFEPHAFDRTSKNNVLVVKVEAATLAFVGPGMSSILLFLFLLIRKSWQDSET